MAEMKALGPDVLNDLPPMDCLCLDDVDAVTGDREWERALFSVLRDMQERGTRLVMSAAVPPALVKWSLPDLGSRCSASTVFQLKPLDETEQQEALKLRARIRGVELPDETARWLQRRFPRDMRTLYELLDTLDEASLVAQRRLTVPFIRTVLKDGESGAELGGFLLECLSGSWAAGRLLGTSTGDCRHVQRHPDPHHIHQPRRRYTGARWAGRRYPRRVSAWRVGDSRISMKISARRSVRSS